MKNIVTKLSLFVVLFACVTSSNDIPTLNTNTSAPPNTYDLTNTSIPVYTTTPLSTKIPVYTKEPIKVPAYTSVPQYTKVPTKIPTSVPYTAPINTCCKICTTGKACGDSCISRKYTCHKAPGCACDG